MIHTKQGPKDISKILYVLKLSQNLLNVALLLHKNSFYLKGNSLNHNGLSTKAIDRQRWQHRFGHFNDNALKLLSSMNMV